MDVIIQLANDFFKPILAMGGPIIMLIILTVLALLFGVLLGLYTSCLSC